MLSIVISSSAVAPCVYAELAFDPVEISALSGLGYTVAMVAHVVEEIKEGVPLRIIPEALGAKYVGHPERHIPKHKAQIALQGRKTGAKKKAKDRD